MSDSLPHHELQHARLLCPSLSPRVRSNSCPLSQWCYLTISSFSPSLLLLPSIFPSIRVFSKRSALYNRWSKYWIFSFSVTPSNEYSGLLSFRIDWLDLLAVQGILKSRVLMWFDIPFSSGPHSVRVFFNTTVQKHQFFSTQLSL